LAFNEVVEPQTIFKGILELPYPIYSWGTTVNRGAHRRHGQARLGGAWDTAAGRDAEWWLPTVRHRGRRRAFADFRYTSLADGLTRAGGRQRKA
jgi:hypothetical protein